MKHALSILRNNRADRWFFVSLVVKSLQSQAISPDEPHPGPAETRRFRHLRHSVSASVIYLSSKSVP